MPRGRLIAGLLAVLVPAAVLVSTRAAVADPSTQTEGARTVAVDESSNLPESGATLTVTGTGFDPGVDVYLAICAADTAPADPLTGCLGGEVPGDNTGTAWAVITGSTAGKTNASAFGDGGSFSAELSVDSAVGSSVDCVSNGCVLMVRSVGEQATRPKDITIGLGFVAPTSTSELPATVTPDTIALPQAQVGDQQTVVFSGFTASEDVAVTVFSEPIDVPGIKATAGGVVAITFRVTDALLPGQHTVQAIGAQSGLVGLASFTVVTPAVTTSSTPETSTSSSTAQSTSSTPATTTSASATTGTSATTTSAAVAPTTPSGSGQSLWWLWVTLILLIVIGGIIAMVAMSRRREQQLEQERLDRDRQFAEAAADTPPSAQVWPPNQPWQGGGYPPGGYEPNDPSQSQGLLSGRQGDGPALYSGQGGFPPATPPTPPAPRYEPPTERITAAPTAPPMNPAGSDLPTTAWRTGPNEAPADEPPSTERWSPFGDEDEGTGEPPPRR